MQEIQIIAQHEVQVFTLSFTAVQAEDGFFYVPLTEICRGLKLNVNRQSRHLQEHAVLSEGFCQGVIAKPNGENKMQKLLRIDLLSLWVTHMPVSRLEEPLKTAVYNFQREGAAILQEALAQGRLNDQAQLATLLRRDWPEVRAYKATLISLHTARNKLFAEANLRR